MVIYSKIVFNQLLYSRLYTSVRDFLIHLKTFKLPVFDEFQFTPREKLLYLCEFKSHLLFTVWWVVGYKKIFDGRDL